MGVLRPRASTPILNLYILSISSTVYAMTSHISSKTPATPSEDGRSDGTEMHPAHLSPSIENQPQVAVALVNWNAYEETAQALCGLRSMTSPSVEIIVVDNGSTDGSGERLRQGFPEIALAALPDNCGFGAANNVVLRMASERGIPFVWLLNNDAVPHPEALNRMLDQMHQHPHVGAVGCVVRDMSPPHRVQIWGGGTISLWSGIVRHARGSVPMNRLDFLSAASLLLRTETGVLFDERYFLYWEDADLTRRLRQAGWEWAVASDAEVFHKGSATTGKNPGARSFHSGRNLQLYARTHSHWPRLFGLSSILFQMLFKCLKGNWSAARGFWRGRREGMGVS